MKTMRYLSLALMVFTAMACNNKGKLPIVVTGKYTTYPTTKTVQCEGYVETDGGEVVVDRGICYAAGSVTPTVGDNRVSAGSGKGSFSAVLQNITQGTYSYRAFATNSAGTAYGAVSTFTMSSSSTSGGGESGGGSGGSGSGGSGGSSTLGSSVSDFIGTYSFYGYDADKKQYVTWDDVTISTWTNSGTNTEWIKVAGLNEGYALEAALGEFDATNKAIRLYAYYYLSDYTYKLAGKGDTIFYSMFFPVYAPKGSTTWELITDGAGYNGVGEAWLTFNSSGKLILGPSKTADSKGNYANGFNFVACYAEDNKLFTWYDTFIEVELTKVSSSSAPARTPSRRDWHAPMLVPAKKGAPVPRLFSGFAQ